MDYGLLTTRQLGIPLSGTHVGIVDVLPPNAAAELFAERLKTVFFERTSFLFFVCVFIKCYF